MNKQEFKEFRLALGLSQQQQSFIDLLVDLSINDLLTIITR